LKLIIEINKKLLPKDLSKLIEKYWNESFLKDIVNFDLSITQWISNSELLFVIGWVNHLLEKNISVEIQLPSSKDLPSNTYEYKRRREFQIRLLNDWKIEEILDRRVKVLSGGNI